MSGVASATFIPDEAPTALDTRIADVLTPEKAGEPVRVMSTSDGRVYDVDSSHPTIVGDLVLAQAKNAPVTLTVDSQDRVIEVTELSAPEAEKYADILSGIESMEGAGNESVVEGNGVERDSLVDDETTQPDTITTRTGYRATNVKSMSRAQAMFDQLGYLAFKGSECYQRAHKWSYYMWSDHSVYSMKNFLFFTRKFVREHRYKWWFHVAPMIYVNGEKIMMDAEFGFEKPTRIQEWTDHFMMDPQFVHYWQPSHPVCKETDRYSTTQNNPDNRECYTLQLPMYYYQPVDAENLEDDGTRKDGWNNWDVKHSRKCFKRFWKC